MPLPDLPGESHAGFTITTSKLQVVEVNYKSGQFVLENVDEAYFNEPLDPETDKETKISALLQGAYNELLIKHPLKSSSVSFTLPFELFCTMQVPYDNTLLNQDLVEEFRWEFSLLYPYIPVRELVIQYIEIDKNNLTDHNTAFVAGIQRNFLQLLHNFCSRNNLKLKFVDNVHTAADRSLSVSKALSEEGISLSVYLGNKYLSLIFSAEGKPVKFKIAPLKDASEIPGIIKDALIFNDSFRINRDSINSAYITGEDLSKNLVKSLHNSVGLEFNHFNPFDKIKPEASLLDNKCYTDKPNSFSSAAGIAYRLA